MTLNTMTQPQIKQKDAPENQLGSPAATTQDVTNPNQSPEQMLNQSIEN